jgi:hypothetical protein
MDTSLFAFALERVRAGSTLDQAFAEFLDAFFLTRNVDMQLAVRSEVPPLTGDPHLDALAGAVAEYLARQHRLPRVPDWAADRARYLDRPWHMCGE